MTLNQNPLQKGNLFHGLPVIVESHFLNPDTALINFDPFNSRDENVQMNKWHYMSLQGVFESKGNKKILNLCEAYLSKGIVMQKELRE